MPLGRMNPGYFTSPFISEFVGYVTFTNPAPVGVTTIINTLLRVVSTSNAAGASLGQSANLGPDARMPVVIGPSPAYAPQVATSGALTSMIMLDCRAQNADIVYASAAYCPAPSATPGALPALSSAGLANLMGIDNVNKFIYFQISTLAGAALAPFGGSSVQFNIAFKDTLAI